MLYWSSFSESSSVCTLSHFIAFIAYLSGYVLCLYSHFHSLSLPLSTSHISLFLSLLPIQYPSVPLPSTFFPLSSVNGSVCLLHCISLLSSLTFSASFLYLISLPLCLCLRPYHNVFFYNASVFVYWLRLLSPSCCLHCCLFLCRCLCLCLHCISLSQSRPIS